HRTATVRRSPPPVSGRRASRRRTGRLRRTGRRANPHRRIALPASRRSYRRLPWLSPRIDEPTAVDTLAARHPPAYIRRRGRAGGPARHPVAVVRQRQDALLEVPVSALADPLSKGYIGGVGVARQAPE